MSKGKPENINVGIRIRFEAEIDPLFIGSEYLILPKDLSKTVFDLLENSNSIPIKEIKGRLFVAESWIRDEKDKVEFRDALESDAYAIIKEFLLRMIKQGVNPDITQKYIIRDRGTIGAAGVNSIFRGDFKAGNLKAFIHEFIHIIFDNLTKEQKEQVNHYFYTHHNEELKKLFETEMYKWRSSNYATEALAYYLQLALEGERKNKFKDFALVLKDEDLEFFVELGLISESMKENIKYLLLDKEQKMQDKWNIAEVFETIEAKSDMDFIIAGEGERLNTEIEDGSLLNRLKDVLIHRLNL